MRPLILTLALIFAVPRPASAVVEHYVPHLDLSPGLQKEIDAWMNTVKDIPMLETKYRNLKISAPGTWPNAVRASLFQQIHRSKAPLVFSGHQLKRFASNRRAGELIRSFGYSENGEKLFMAIYHVKPTGQTASYLQVYLYTLKGALTSYAEVPAAQILVMP